MFISRNTGDSFMAITCMLEYVVKLTRKVGLHNHLVSAHPSVDKNVCVLHRRASRIPAHHI